MSASLFSKLILIYAPALSPTLNYLQLTELLYTFNLLHSMHCFSDIWSVAALAVHIYGACFLNTEVCFSCWSELHHQWGLVALRLHCVTYGVLSNSYKLSQTFLPVWKKLILCSVYCFTGIVLSTILFSVFIFLINKFHILSIVFIYCIYSCKVMSFAQWRAWHCMCATEESSLHRPASWLRVKQHGHSFFSFVPYHLLSLMLPVRVLLATITV